MMQNWSLLAVALVCAVTVGVGSWGLRQGENSAMSDRQSPADRSDCGMTGLLEGRGVGGHAVAGSLDSGKSGAARISPIGKCSAGLPRPRRCS